MIMKKIFYMISAVAALTACSTEGSGSAAEEVVTLDGYTDSLSYYMGNVHGNYVGMSLAQMPEDFTSKIDKKAFMEGFRAALQVDAAHVAQMYGINHGVSLWTQNQIIKNVGVAVDYDKMLSGFSAGLDMDSTRMAELEAADDVLFGLMKEVNQKIIAYQQEQQAKAQSDMQRVAEDNLKAGKDYMARQRLSDESYKLTDTGVAYKIVAAGSGSAPKAQSVVKVIYSGSFTDGEVFDSSEGQPVEFSLEEVIPGFRDAMMLIGKGGKIHAIIPGDQAYGLQAPPSIGPNRTLVFDMELVDILPDKK